MDLAELLVPGGPPDEGIRLALELINVPSGAVVEIGCGTGRNLVAMAKRFQSACGLNFVTTTSRKLG